MPTHFFRQFFSKSLHSGARYAVCNDMESLAISAAMLSIDAGKLRSDPSLAGCSMTDCAMLLIELSALENRLFSLGNGILNLCILQVPMLVRCMRAFHLFRGNNAIQETNYERDYCE